MENLLSEFQESLKRLGVTKKDRLLLAVSGGLDSVVLTACCFASGLDFGIAHVNFQLRAAESERDEAFVRRLADKYQKPFYTTKFDTEAFAVKEKISIQTAARNLRYAWFDSLLGKEPLAFRFLLTAHHLDDNIETMFMHFFRGTGIAGICGMPEKKDKLLRPLLSVSKNRLKAFADSGNLEWVEDSSNSTSDYTRNYFRNSVIPSITAVFPELHHNLEKNLQRFSDAYMLYQQAIGLHKKTLLKPNGAEMHIPVLLLKKSAPLETIIYEIIKDYHFSPSQTDDVIRLMESSNGKYVSSATHRIIKNRKWLIIAPNLDESVSHVVVEQHKSPVNYPEGMLYIKEIVPGQPGYVSVPDGTEILDASKIQFPLMLRKWKAGDYFYPLGMKKKKKLARFFIDQKLSKTIKEKTWVLVMDSQIVWVVGHRIDNRFRVTDETRQMLMIRKE
jgi:tRNA(Ile)-lysidine synthase